MAYFSSPLTKMAFLMIGNAARISTKRFGRTYARILAVMGSAGSPQCSAPSKVSPYRLGLIKQEYQGCRKWDVYVMDYAATIRR
jgi:hypothetical protein